MSIICPKVILQKNSCIAAVRIKMGNRRKYTQVRQTYSVKRLFKITLDELILNKTDRQQTITETIIAETPQDTKNKEKYGQKIIDYILFSIGLNCIILSFFFGRLFLVLGVYTLFCSIICLCIRNHAILIIGWTTMLILLIISPFIFGFNILHSILIGIFFFILMFYTGYLIYKKEKRN